MITVNRKLRILNLMETLGMGGGQTMMFELSNGLNKYYGDHCCSLVAGTKNSAGKVVVYHKLLQSYGIDYKLLSWDEIAKFCKRESIDVVLHHRVSISSPLRAYIPKHIPYIVISHTAASIEKIKDFYKVADYLVSVCQNLLKYSPKIKYLSPERMPVILNGIENDFIKDIEPLKLRGVFKTGRCHRLVPTKFALDSLGWFENNRHQLLGHVHYLMGTGNKALPHAAQNKQSIVYVGEISDRQIKYSYLKAFDAYFYEINCNEGASMAVLESLGCGVPVICRPKGGIKELVTHKVNGFIERDRPAMLRRLQKLMKNDKLPKLKEAILKDFDERLHVRHCAKRYLNLCRQAVSEKTGDKKWKS